MKKLLTKKEVSKMLGKSLRSVDRLKLPVEAVMGRTLLFSEEEVKKHIPKKEQRTSILEKVFGKQEPELVFADVSLSSRSDLNPKELTILKAMKMAKEGRSNEEIKKATGIPTGTIGYYCKKFKISRKKGMVKGTKKENVLRWNLIAKELNA